MMINTTMVYARKNKYNVKTRGTFPTLNYLKILLYYFDGVIKIHTYLYQMTLFSRYYSLCAKRWTDGQTDGSQYEHNMGKQYELPVNFETMKPSDQHGEYFRICNIIERISVVSVHTYQLYL